MLCHRFICRVTTSAVSSYSSVIKNYIGGKADCAQMARTTISTCRRGNVRNSLGKRPRGYKAPVMTSVTARSCHECMAKLGCWRPHISHMACIASRSSGNRNMGGRFQCRVAATTGASHLRVIDRTDSRPIRHAMAGLAFISACDMRRGFAAKL